MIARIVVVQADSIGDGTTSTMLFIGVIGVIGVIGELLKQSERCIEGLVIGSYLICFDVLNN
jgi:chaperonin GroEL (HSP60 family)